MTSFPFASACLAAALSISAPTHAQDASFKSEVARITARNPYGEKAVDVIVQRGKFVSTAFSLTALRWGTEGRIPASIVARVGVRVGAKEVFVPLSAYCDLANPSKVSVEFLSAEDYRVVIKGGEASTSYGAELFFHGDQITRRKVIHGEFPLEAWEETRYSFNNSDQ